MNWARAYFGALIALVGGLWLLDAVELVDAGEVFATWWPLALIGGGVVGFVLDRRHWIPPFLLVAVGTSLLLSSLGIADAAAVILPSVLVIIGVLLVMGRGFGANRTKAGDRVSSFNMFSGSEIASHSAAFEGGSIGAVFGGAELDLRDARPAPGATLDVFSAFGGVDIKVPEGWRVDIAGLPLFGGFENVTTKDRLEPDAPALHIDATVLFGGLAVKH